MARRKKMISRNIAALGLVLATTATAQIVGAPQIHWIGPEGNCDFPSIQAALDEIFDCPLGVFCPPVRNELRLSNNYAHSGQIVVNRSFDIRGGYVECEGAQFGVNTNLDAPRGQPLIVVQPGSSSIDNEFRSVSLTGGASVVDRGGVIRMDSGDARLTLRDTLVRRGNAVRGGGIFLNGDGNVLVLQDTRVLNHVAMSGGGIFCAAGGVIDFHSGAVESNSAELSGGGIYLESECRLLGTTPGVVRRIQDNSISDSQLGQGAGVYALDSTIEMGALLSRTIFQENKIAFLPLHHYDRPGQNRGGAVHLQSSEASFYNTWFRGNEAADGGAISAVGDSVLLVDRYSGPCDASDEGNAPDCSLFEFNRVRGGEDDDGEEGGDGAVLFTASASGSFPTTTINRTTIRTNFAGCFEINPPVFSGECDLDIDLSGPRFTSQSIISRVSALSGNLLYGNDIGDDGGCGGAGCTKEGFYVFTAGEFAENTLAENHDADEIFYRAPDRMINNLIWDFEPDRGVREDDEKMIGVSSCNVSNFAEEFDELADSVPVAGVNAEPFFVNPDLGSSPNESFQVQSVNSPAIDRCDDQGGRLELSYDILGNPRAVDIGGIGNGPGPRDAGAFEFVQDGTINDTSDLDLSIVSDLPRRAEIDQPHGFIIRVTNTGRNPVAAMSVYVALNFIGTMESLRGVNTFDANGNLVETWDCDRFSRRCSYLSADLGVGSTAPEIVAEMSFNSAGLKTVKAEVRLEDSSLTEVNPSNDQSTDTVTVGPGADVSVDLVSDFPGVADLNQPHLLFFLLGNRGPEAAEDLQLHLTAPGALIEFSPASGWTCDNNARMCTRSGPMQPDAREEFTAEVRYDEPGAKLVEAEVMRVGGLGDPDQTNNVDTGVVTVNSPPPDALFADSFERVQ